MFTTHPLEFFVPSFIRIFSHLSVAVDCSSEFLKKAANSLLLPEILKSHDENRLVTKILCACGIDYLFLLSSNSVVAYPEYFSPGLTVAKLYFLGLCET